MDPLDPLVLDPTTVAMLVAGVGLAVLCGGGSLLLLVMLYVGFVLLRRDGEKVTVRRAVRRGAHNVSRIFVRKEGVGSPFEDHGGAGGPEAPGPDDSA